MRRNQVLKTEPAKELKFRGPSNSPKTCLLRLTNPSQRRVCFKFKTTLPLGCTVRPNSGCLDPATSTLICIDLLPGPAAGPEGGPPKKNPKFMLQSMFAPENVADLNSVWKDVAPSNLMETIFQSAVEIVEVSGTKETEIARLVALMGEQLKRKLNEGGPLEITMGLITIKSGGTPAPPLAKKLIITLNPTL